MLVLSLGCIGGAFEGVKWGGGVARAAIWDGGEFINAVDHNLSSESP